jgi:hypothetical protein
MILFNYYYYLLIGGSHPVYSLYGWLQSSLLLLMKDLAAVEETVGLGVKERSSSDSMQSLIP